MALNDFDFRPDYNKADHDIAAEFYLPCMENSIIYDRVSGYFGSTIYIIAWPALKKFVYNGGKMRIICSPYIIEEDQIALNEGYAARGVKDVEAALIDEINNMLNDAYLSKPSRILACLVAMGVIDLKVAIIKPEATPEVKRLFHDKVGIFKDSLGNAVGFRGSMNETFKGLSADGNIESIDVFPNWIDSRDKQRVDNAIRYFNDLWNNNILHIDVCEFPKTAKEIFEKHASQANWEELVDEVTVQLDKAKMWSADKKKGGRIPRPHQVSALEAWEQRGRRGILEHATGSGKTFTALCAIRNSLEKNEVPIILVPSKELLNQWFIEIRETLSDLNLQILICGDGHNRWKKPGYLASWTRRGLSRHRIILSTMDTASSDQFLSAITSGEHLFIVADEAHRIGSPYHRKILSIKSGPRLALSATPRRYGDPEGTQAIFDYFGDIIPPPFTLKDAIDSGVLTKYMYYPHQIRLSESEQKIWDELSEKLSKLIATKKKDDSDISFVFEDGQIKNLLIQRAKILKTAIEKVSLALNVIQEHYLKGQRWIIYCDNQGQLKQVLNLLVENGYDAYEYHSAMNGDRNETLRYFEINGGILVSIKCLDEGVDIPAATHALILASSKNPREFIQRRGRILRRAQNKHFAYLHDAIVIPNTVDPENMRQLSIIESELARAIQFGQWAENPACITKLRTIAIDHDIDIVESMNGGYEDDEK